jgi:hypothetical protein
MGLDMRPMGKPKPGFEERYKQIFRIIHGTEKQELSLMDRIKGKRLLTEKELLKEWFDNQISTYETIKAPRVGRDKEADEWAKKAYSSKEREISETEFLKKYEGYYVIELAKETDGVPVYISLNQDENVFRGQFLTDCIDIIGKDLVSEAWESKFADETLNYGNRLMTVADKIANENNLQYLKQQRLAPEEVDENSIESKLHILFSVAKWLIFYGKNGHGYEADF